MFPKVHELTVILQRDGPKTQWGFRLVGGSDLDTPLIITKVILGSPAFGSLERGDIITKIGDYDSRDLRHIDAQDLFKSAQKSIRVVVSRDNKLKKHLIDSSASVASSAAPSPVPSVHFNLPNSDLPHRGPTPLPSVGALEAAIADPVDTLPRTVFPPLNPSGGYIAPYANGDDDGRRSCFSPMPTRDHQQEFLKESIAIAEQPYRTTPLILPGAKVKKEVVPTESYLRHHPNPSMRGGPSHHVDDVLMKQRVADSVLHRVIGEDSKSGKVQHKQFNSPIGLYSDNNIENTIRQTVPSSSPYKKTFLYDPTKSETYRAIHEENYSNSVVHEIPISVAQPRAYHPNRLVPGKKPPATYPPPNPAHYQNVNTMGDSNETIHQSHSFKRLMHSVLGQTDY